MLERSIVIGTFSFVGFHLTKNLLDEGLTVYGIDIEQTQEDELEEKQMTIGRNSNFNYINQKEYGKWSGQFNEEIEALFFTQELECNKEGEEIAKQSLYKAIEFCKRHSTKLIYLSTTEIVSHDHTNITEQSQVSPVNKRGEMYLKLENIIMDEWLKQNFPYLILRLPTLYGPWQPEAFAYQQALRLLEAGKELEWVEDNYIGDVLYIDDAVKAIKHAANSTNTKDVIHITTGNAGEWIKGMEYLLQTKSSERQIDFLLSNKKAKELLDFQPVVSIEEGLRNQRSHLRKRLAKDLQ